MSHSKLAGDSGYFTFVGHVSWSGPGLSYQLLISFEQATVHVPLGTDLKGQEVSCAFGYSFHPNLPKPSKIL